MSLEEKDGPAPDTIEIEGKPELEALVEQVVASGQPCELTLHGKRVATVRAGEEALRTGREATRTWRPTEAQIERTLAAVGGWRGLVDCEQLKRDIEATRSVSYPRHLELNL